MALKMIRWVMGYVAFTITGHSPERFLTLAAREGYVLWDICKTETGHQARISCRKYRKLRSAARRAGVLLRVQERHGIPFAWRTCRDKRGLLYGAVGAIVVLILLSMRVWCIDVEGNEVLSVHEIKQVAAECGLYTGVAKAELEPKVIQQRLMARFPEIGWVAVNTWGNTATIRLQEGKKIPEVEDTKKPTNVMAAREGQILAMDIYHGAAEVKIGDAVTEGQLLISGVLEGVEGRESLIHASAKIMAQTRRVFVMEVPLEQIEEQPNGKQVVRRSLHLFGAELPLSLQGVPDSAYTRTLEEKPLVLNGVALPVTLYEETFTMKEPVKIILTQQQARQKALEEIQKKQREVLANPAQDGEVLSFTEQEQVRDGVYRLELDCVCRENIAVEQEILLETEPVL